eukprot:gene22973-30162_t
MVEESSLYGESLAAGDIYNLDENCFMPDGKDLVVYGVPGTGHAHILGGDNRESLTILDCICADGSTLTPLVMGKGKELTKPNRWAAAAEYLKHTTWAEAGQPPRSSAWELAHSPSNVQTAFACTGIWPPRKEAVAAYRATAPDGVASPVQPFGEATPDEAPGEANALDISSIRHQPISPTRNSSSQGPTSAMTVYVSATDDAWTEDDVKARLLIFEGKINQLSSAGSAALMSARPPVPASAAEIGVPSQKVPKAAAYALCSIQDTLKGPADQRDDIWKQKMRTKKKPQDAVLLTSQETLQVKRAAIEVKEKRAEDVDARRVERLRKKESQAEEKSMKAAAREAKKKLRRLAENEKATAKLTKELSTTVDRVSSYLSACCNLHTVDLSEFNFAPDTIY